MKRPKFIYTRGEIIGTIFVIVFVIVCFASCLGDVMINEKTGAALNQDIDRWIFNSDKGD